MSSNTVSYPLLEECYALPLHEELLKDLISQAKDYALTHGMVVRRPDALADVDTSTYIAMTLLPSPVPRALYEHAIAVHTDYNLLMHRVAHDHEFLCQCLESTVKVDTFTKRLWDMYLALREEGFTQPICLGLHRSDYMLDYAPDSQEATGRINPKDVTLKQTEFNTISTGLVGLTVGISKVHRYVLENLGVPDIDKRIPENNTLKGYGRAMAKAWELYGNEQAAILFVVMYPDFNTYDQRWFEFETKLNNRKIRVFRRTLQEAYEQTSLTEDKRLFLNGIEIAVVYYRSAYTDVCYPTEECWEVRRRMERSRAIKCPNVHYQLVGTKKVQQMLAKPGVLERFLDDPEAVTRVRETFAGQYGMEVGDEGDEAIAHAIANPSRYVMKAQREGGGFNYFDEEMKEKLEECKDTAERLAYILMDRIRSAGARNYMIVPGKKETPELLVLGSELGTFGAFIGSPDQVYLNEVSGPLLRSKEVDRAEGGTARGTAVIDSPFLVD